jgi:putative DNA primase/helicase
MWHPITAQDFPQSPRTIGQLENFSAPLENSYCAEIRNTLGFAPEHIVPGQLMRFATSHKSGDLAGWAVLFSDYSGGVFGCWRQGIKKTWHRRYLQTDRERQIFVEHMLKAKAKLRAQEEVMRDECRKKAERMWLAGRGVPEHHPYVLNKRIVPFGARVIRETILISVRDNNGCLRGLQLIGVDGVKRFLTGTVVAGNYGRIGSLSNEVVLVCEGWATGCSLHEATGHAVAVAFAAGNLKPVSEGLRQKFPEGKLIVCADDDHASLENRGMSAAVEAAKAIGGLLAIPDFTKVVRRQGDSDFNDQAQLKGIDTVARIIREVTRV